MFRKRPLPVPEIAGNRVRVFRDGDEAFPAMLDAIGKAERFVCLETYILRDDRIGWEFAMALGEAARRGVEVSLLFDSFGSIELSDAFLNELRQSGVRLCEYHPVAPWRKGFDLNHRDHRKQLIVDGRIGFLGGLNIADEYRTDTQGEAWRDTHVEVAGPAVRTMVRLFLFTWIRHGGAPIDGPRYRVQAAPEGGVAVRVLGNRRHTDRGTIRKAYIQAFDGAESKILITNSYFVPDREIRTALRAAALRGVRVSLLLSGRSDVITLRAATRRHYQSLLDDGLELYEWNLTILHAKTAVVDSDWATIGSYNLNWRSFFHNLECNLFLRDEGVVRDLTAMFWDDVSESTRVDYSFLDRLSVAEKAYGRVAALFRYWL